MQLARVIGTVVATIKNESLNGRKLLVIQSLDGELKPQGKPLVAVDSVGAGEGELVFWCRGNTQWLEPLVASAVTFIHCQNSFTFSYQSFGCSL